MSNNALPIVAEGSLKSYLTGFFLSIALTCLAFGLAYYSPMSVDYLVLTLIALAVVQFIVQMVFFFHVWHDASPHWNTLAFIFMLFIVFILVWGTWWIMYHLDYRMMDPSHPMMDLRNHL